MIRLISNVTQTDLAAASASKTSSATPAKASNLPQSQPAVNIPVDTVHISSAAVAAMKEAAETPAQTMREANAGDHRAQRILAKEQPVK